MKKHDPVVIVQKTRTRVYSGALWLVDTMELMDS